MKSINKSNLQGSNNLKNDFSILNNKTKKQFLNNLVKIRMNEIFPRLAFYSQKLIFVARKSRQR